MMMMKGREKSEDILQEMDDKKEEGKRKRKGL